MRILIIVGGSTTGKTDFAFALAQTLTCPVVCGDQWQLIAGHPLATGISDAERHASISRKMYGMLPATSADTLTANEYEKSLDGVLSSHSPDDLIVIDSLSLAYFSVIPVLRRHHRVLVIGIRPNWRTPFRLAIRMWNKYRAGVIGEIRNGSNGWYRRNSFVAQEILSRSAVGAAIAVFWRTIRGEAIYGKHRRIIATGLVDYWL